MPQLPADGKSGFSVDLTLFRVHGLAAWPTGGRRLPAGQFLVAVLGIMTKAVHVGEPGAQGITLVDAELLHIVAVARDQGAKAGQPPCAVQHLPLFRGADRDGAFPAALGPARLEHQVVAPVGKARYELDRLFPAQAEGLLQFQAHAHMRVTDLVQLGQGRGRKR